MSKEADFFSNVLKNKIDGNFDMIEEKLSEIQTLESVTLKLELNVKKDAKGKFEYSGFFGSQKKSVAVKDCIDADVFDPDQPDMFEESTALKNGQFAKSTMKKA